MSTQPRSRRATTDPGPGALLDERLADLSRRIDEWLEETQARGSALQQLLAEARQLPLIPSAGQFPPQESGSSDDALRAVASLACDVEASADQIAILGRLVEASAMLAPRVMLFVVKNKTLKGWAARGFAAKLNHRTVVMALEGGDILHRAVSECATVREQTSERPGNGRLASKLGSTEPAEMLAAPLWIRDHVAAVLYADSGEADSPWYPDAISVAATLAALSLEALPFRGKHPRPERPAAPFESAAVAAQPSQSDTASRDAAPLRVEMAAAGEPAGAIGDSGSLESVDPEQQRKLEDAQRFARLLVSEILLYNEREIEEGRRNKDLYARLKEDIDRSHQMYEQRIGNQITGSADYFREELVRTLAAGDEDALSLPWG